MTRAHLPPALLCLLGAACAPPPPTISPGQRCAESAGAVRCERQTLRHVVQGETREVHFQVPLGDAPPTGWPAAFVFQGSGLGADPSWEASDATPFGGLHQARLTAALLGAGIAVITPEARGDGSTYWDTNVPPHAGAWEASPDHALMLALLADVDGGAYGPLHGARLFAAGISSGGYMTSRVAAAYPGRFAALAIHSASWATCGGAACVLPAELPAAHPPTLFLHGEGDLVVPAFTMTRFADALEADGVLVERELRPGGHAWLPEAPARITGFFSAR